MENKATLASKRRAKLLSSSRNVAGNTKICPPLRPPPPPPPKEMEMNHRQIESTPITPHRKAKATVVFSEAAAASVQRRDGVTKSTLAEEEITSLNHDETTPTKQEEEDDPLQNIQNLLSSIPNLDFVSPKKSKTLSGNSNDEPTVESEEEDNDSISEFIWLQKDFSCSKETPCDATCIPNGSKVMLSNLFSGRTMTIANCPENSQQSKTNCGLSHPEECFSVSIFNTNNNDPIDANCHECKLLRYGQVIALCCPSTGLALGIRKINYNLPTSESTTEADQHYYQVGFFRTLHAQLDAEKWVVLPSSNQKHYITIGTIAALLPTTTSVSNNYRTTATPNKNNGDHIGTTLCHVSIHDGIVLRNVLTGGLLSYRCHDNGEEEWSLLTSAYQQESHDHRDWRKSQHKVIPSIHETFCLRPANLPPINTTLFSNRYFLNHTHLKNPQRHIQKQTYSLPPHQIVIPHTNPNNFDGSQRDNEPKHYDTLLVQEQLLLDELLGCMLGLGGRYIQASQSDHFINGSANFKIVRKTKLPDDWNISLLNLAEQILPLCNQYVRVQEFVTSRLNGYEFGKVAHALCGAMETLLKEYLDFVIKLENEFISTSSKKCYKSKMTLLSLWATVQPAMQTMSVLDNIVTVTQSTKGGSLLNSLHDVHIKHYFGNVKAQRIFHFLLEKASVPYMQMLDDWLKSGALSDPYSEFMIEETIQDMEKISYMDDDEDWDNWYMIREEHVLRVFTDTTSKAYNNFPDDEKFNFCPHMIRSDEADEMVRKVLTAGKYWNAISLCRNNLYRDKCHWISRHRRNIQLATCTNIDNDSMTSLKYWMNQVDIFKYVEHAYRSSSKKFFHIVLKEHELLMTLRFLKRYFLLDQGDFFVHFLDMAEDELLQEMCDVSRGRVQNWMNLSIQLCSGVVEGSPQWAGGNIKADRNDNPRPILDIITSSLKCDFATASVVEHLDAIHSNNGGISSNEPKTPSRHLYGGSNKGLTGVEALMMDFEKIPFPLSLVLSRRAISNYQLLFRHLFFAKHVERRLFGTWLDHQMIKEFQVLRKELGPTYILRQRMLHFMQNLVYYMLFEVIEPSWLRMKAKILQKTNESVQDDFTLFGREEGNQTVDDILRTHKDFMRRILKECLLTNRDLIHTLTKLMTTCLLFSDQMKLFMKTTKIEEEQDKIAINERHRRSQRGFIQNSEKKIQLIHRNSMEERKLRKQKQIDRLQHELNTESYKRMISRFEQVFDSNLSEFMTQLISDNDGRYHTHLSNLCIRLDFNGFVTKSMKLDN